MRRLLIAMISIIAPSWGQAIEEPEYETVRQVGSVELRRYAAYRVAEVTVAGPSQDAGSTAFPILAGYIFGKNQGERKLEMTAPVTQAAVPVKMEMTAPVTQAATDAGYNVQFVLPRSVTLESAPVPLDARIRIREVPPRMVAVIRYSGFWSVANYEEHLGQLTATLKSHQLRWSGEPVYARYNAPFTPWFLRRNEIWLTLLPEGAPER